MATVRLSWDRWEGGRILKHSKDNPSAAEIEQAIDRLDAREFSTVAITNGPVAHLVIGGGGSKYVVYATYDNQTFFNLIGDMSLRGTEQLLIGGQVGDYPKSHIVNRSRALAAAVAFAREGRLEASLRWQ